MSNRVKHFIIGALILLGAGILFIPAWFDKIPFTSEPLALPEKTELSGPVPFLQPPNAKVDEINRSITDVRQQSMTDLTSKQLPTPAWTIQLDDASASAKVEVRVAQLQARGYFAYAREDAQKISHVFVGPEIKKQRAEQLLVQLRKELKMNGKVEQYLP